MKRIFAMVPICIVLALLLLLGISACAPQKVLPPDIIISVRQVNANKPFFADKKINLRGVFCIENEEPVLKEGCDDLVYGSAELRKLDGSVFCADSCNLEVSQRYNVVGLWTRAEDGSYYLKVYTYSKI